VRGRKDGAAEDARSDGKRFDLRVWRRDDNGASCTPPGIDSRETRRAYTRTMHRFDLVS